MTAVERLVVRLMADATQYNRIFSTAETRLLTFASIATAVTLEAGRHAIQLAAEYEDAAVSFKVLTGSAEGSRKMLADIDAFALATPFKSEDLREQAKTMAGFGVEIDNILPSLKALGDVVAGVGGGTERLHRIMYNFSQVMAQGRPYWIDIKQFAMAGIDIREFAKTAGVSVAEFREMVEEGKIGSDVVIKTFNRMTAAGGKFNNLMGDLSQTGRGQWRALKEQFDLVLRDVGVQILGGLKDSGAFEHIRKLFSNIQANLPEIRTFFKDAFGLAQELTAGVVSGWVEVKKLIIEINEFLKQNKSLADSAAASIGETFGMAKEDANELKLTWEGFVGMLVAIPAILQDAMNILRVGMFAVLGGMSMALKYMDEAITKMYNKAHLLAMLTGVDIGSFEVSGPIQHLPDVFMEGMAESIDKVGATKKALDSYVDRLIDAKRKGKDFADILKTIPPIKVPPSFLPPDMMKFLEESRKGFKEHGDPMDLFARQIDAAHKAKRIFEMLGPGTDFPGLNDAQHAFAVTKAFKDVEKALHFKEELKLPQAMLRGSADAQDTINKANIKQQTTAERVLDVLLTMKIIQEQLKDEAKEIRDAIERAAKEGLIKKGI